MLCLPSEADAFQPIMERAPACVLPNGCTSQKASATIQAQTAPPYPLPAQLPTRSVGREGFEPSYTRF